MSRVRVHVTPVGDLIVHEETPDCICGPDLDADDGRHIEVYYHHSLDGRERAEQFYDRRPERV